MDRYEDYIQQVGYEQAQSDGVITMAEQDNYIEWYATYQMEEECENTSCQSSGQQYSG